MSRSSAPTWRNRRQAARVFEHVRLRPGAVKNIRWSADDNSGVYYSVEEKGSSHIYFAPVNGARRQITSGVHILNGFSLADNGQAAAVRTTPQAPGALVTFNMKDAAKATELVDVNADVLAGLKLGDAEELWFTSKDGLKVQGWLIKPANFEAGKKYPMVLWIHGGPWSMYSVVGATDGASWYYQFQKRPWEDPMEFAVRSPLHYVASVKTPTMIMTGEADLRTPMGQSEEFYRALKMLKKDTLLVRMPDEFHGRRRPSHQLAQQLYLMAWFEKHMRKEAANAGGADN